MRAWICGWVIGAAGGCWSSAQPAPAPAPEPRAAPSPAPAPPAAPAAPAAIAAPACDRDPATDKSAAALIACAREALAEGSLDTASTRAAQLRKTYPYSKYAVEAQELDADILSARGAYAEAAQAYRGWLHDHPTNPRGEDVKRKQQAATDRANGTTGLSPRTGR